MPRFVEFLSIDGKTEVLFNTDAIECVLECEEDGKKHTRIFPLGARDVSDSYDVAERYKDVREKLL